MVERIIIEPFSVNTYLFSEWKKECIVVDPGGEAEKIIDHMTTKNLKPRGIVCTHGHLDHIGAIIHLKDYYLKKGIILKVAAHENDAQFFGAQAKSIHIESLKGIPEELFDEFNIPLHTLPDIDIPLKEGDTLFDSDLTVIHTPGHTPGSISLYSESQNFLFSGDTLFFESIGRTDLPGGDGDAIIKSIKDKILTLPPETRVLPGHGPITSVERETKTNPFLR